MRELLLINSNISQIAEKTLVLLRSGGLLLAGVMVAIMQAA